MKRFTMIALAATFAALLAAGCDNRTKTEKAMDNLKEKGAALKEKLAAGMSKLKAAATQKEFVEQANEQKNTIKAKIDELAEKIKKENPEMAAKMKEQMNALKRNLGEMEDAITKAAKDPEKTWESMKAKAIAAMEEAQRNMQQP